MSDLPNPPSNTDRNIALGIGLGLLAVCCACVVTLAGAGYFGYRFITSTEFAPLWTDTFATSAPTITPNLVLTPLPTPVPGAGDTVQILSETIVPQRDLREVAMRLKGIADIPEVVSTQPADYTVGDQVEFHAGDDSTQTYFTVDAILIYATDNVYFFVDDSVKADAQDVKRLADAFQNEIYPTDREFFGSEWTPGVDGDPHIYILYARGLGASVAGYYSSVDEYSRLAYERSNEKEMFYINADGVELSDDYVYSTLAHEFQHMIHWYHDRNEESWMNEGAAELAAFLNGYDVGGADYLFASEPDLQLTAWADANSPDFFKQYGSAFLFMTYFLDRFGPEATQKLVADPANGLQAVGDVLQAEGVADPLTGQPITANDVFADWVVANYLGDRSVADGRYGYGNYAEAPRVTFPADTFYTCPTTYTATVHQYGADYYEIQCGGQITIDFTGSQQVQLNPTQAHSGRYAFWGNRSDDSDTTLTREFDLTGVQTATLKYWLWTRIEKNFDYAYLVVSRDDGATWEIVRTPSGTDRNPTSANLGWGYTGNTGGGDPGAGDSAVWIEETVNLTPYAGQKILVRFEYITDAALNYSGIIVDDMSVPELGYSADFETDDGGWQGAGFVRVDNLLSQGFIVQVIRRGVATTVERLPLDEANTGSLTLNLKSDESATLVVSGITPFTTESTSYRFEIK